MKKLILLCSLALIGLAAGDAASRGPGGARPSGGARPGGGGHPTPSFSGHAPTQHPVNRPNGGGGHPGFVPHNQPHPTPANRPNGGAAHHPNQPPGNQGNVNRPNINTGNQGNVNRPNINTGNQTNVHRPNVNTGNQVNRTNVGNRTNNPYVGNSVNNSGNRVVNNQSTTNNTANVNRSAGYNYYQGNWSGWHRGYWNNWNYRPAVWAGVGAAGVAAGGWLLGGGNYAYANPFYTAPPNVAVQALDYSQPIVVPVPQPVPVPAQGPDNAPPPQPNPPAVPDDANRSLEAARAAFRAGDYPRAQTLTEKAIAALPDDSTLHEFRALTLFAQKNYKDAAAAIYAVLSAGPGWNWDTMKSFYPDVNTYTAQLRALESHARANPKYGEDHFLLAYHYLVLNQSDAAVKQLQQVVQLVPNDKLSPQLIKAFSPPTADRPAAQMP